MGSKGSVVGFRQHAPGVRRGVECDEHDAVAAVQGDAGLGAHLQDQAGAAVVEAAPAPGESPPEHPAISARAQTASATPTRLYIFNFDNPFIP